MEVFFPLFVLGAGILLSIAICRSINREEYRNRYMCPRCEALDDWTHSDNGSVRTCFQCGNRQRYRQYSRHYLDEGEDPGGWWEDESAPAAE